VWKNDGYSETLYCVKRKNCEWYYTGGYRTGSKPQLYTKGHATAARNRLNKYLLAELEKGPKSFEEWVGTRMDNEITRGWYDTYVSGFAAGPWVVAELQLCASEVE
jgi:hypothetical protein